VSRKSQPIVVTVTDEALENIERVAEALSAKGMKVHRVMPHTGVITGSYASSNRSALKKVAGVMSVEDEAAAAELPSPDSPLQ
jgi:hypothetical protein